MKRTLTIDDYLDHMRRSVRDVFTVTDQMSLDAFERDRVAQLATVKAIENIGEAAGCVQRDFSEFAETESSVAWRNWRAVRNRLTHAYFDVDLEIVWNVVQKEIPALERALTIILAKRS